MSAKPWGGAFDEKTDPLVEKFTESISFDHRLAPVDIRGSQAHARMLTKVGLLSEQECQLIVATLDTIGGEIARGEMEWKTELEDIHMHIESALIQRIGDVGRKLHTGRSRNDQVSTDLKLYVRECLTQLDQLLLELQRAFVDRCDGDADVVLPGFTHLQRAQPVMAAHYWLAYCEKFQRDRDRLADCLKRVNVLPLGAAALAGTSLPIDRHESAQLLGFVADDLSPAVAANSLDVSSDRDFLAEAIFDMSLIAVHLSGWAEEWILWCTTEFGFLKLPDAYTTGSSIMPQKRNPDVLELIRGKSARVIADVTQILTLLKGLPLAYNRDLQEDKLAFFDAFDTVYACVELAPRVVRRAKLQLESINARLEEGFLDATTLMEYLISRGVPMRTGHEVVGKLVRLCESKGCKLAELSLPELQVACDKIEADVSNYVGVRNVVARLSSFGSGGRNPVLERVASWKSRLQS
ncbi:argininosuccinate lyase [Schlesneria paludicola]|uniref:argininosuccinate lyase n=1 Tax=Schlesneria paludicola TaxID=360056 RepID=UPI00029AA340|nr:argininosuccinate lyase [Schlesneria paludicola]